MKRASDILSSLLDENTRESARSYDSAFRGWRDLAGLSLAEHSRVYEIKHHSLFVEVDHNGWMQILLLRKRRILNRLQRVLPELEIRDLKIRINPALSLDRASFREPEPPSAREGAPPRETGPGAVPYSTSPGSVAPADSTAAPPDSSSPSAEVPAGVEEVEQIVAEVGQETLKRQLRNLFLGSLRDERKQS